MRYESWLNRDRKGYESWLNRDREGAESPEIVSKDLGPEGVGNDR